VVAAPGPVAPTTVVGTVDVVVVGSARRSRVLATRSSAVAVRGTPAHSADAVPASAAVGNADDEPAKRAVGNGLWLGSTEPLSPSAAGCSAYALAANDQDIDFHSLHAYFDQNKERRRFCVKQPTQINFDMPAMTKSTATVDLATERFRATGGIGERMVQTEEDVLSACEFRLNNWMPAYDIALQEMRDAFGDDNGSLKNKSLLWALLQHSHYEASLDAAQPPATGGGRMTGIVTRYTHERHD
jgi:hypothetical protein